MASQEEGEEDLSPHRERAAVCVQEEGPPQTPALPAPRSHPGRQPPELWEVDVCHLSRGAWCLWQSPSWLRPLGDRAAVNPAVQTWSLGRDGFASGSRQCHTLCLLSFPISKMEATQSTPWAFPGMKGGPVCVPAWLGAACGRVMGVFIVYFVVGIWLALWPWVGSEGGTGPCALWSPLQLQRQPSFTQFGWFAPIAGGFELTKLTFKQSRQPWEQLSSWLGCWSCCVSWKESSPRAGPWGAKMNWRLCPPRGLRQMCEGPATAQRHISWTPGLYVVLWTTKKQRHHQLNCNIVLSNQLDLLSAYWINLSGSVIKVAAARVSEECSGFHVQSVIFLHDTCGFSTRQHCRVIRSIYSFILGEEDCPWANICANLPLFCMWDAATAWLDEQYVDPHPGCELVNPKLPKQSTNSTTLPLAWPLDIFWW